MPVDLAAPVKHSSVVPSLCPRHTLTEYRPFLPRPPSRTRTRPSLSPPSILSSQDRFSFVGARIVDLLLERGALDEKSASELAMVPGELVTPRTTTACRRTSLITLLRELA